ncbi:MAG: isoleucine--tRNA ligase [Enterobacterales bacterium]
MFNYKNTLNLPYTKFPMRGNLSENEPKILKIWLDANLYEIVRNSKNNKKKFILHDGPPYANGNIHIGHAVNKILKDIIIKYKGLMGFDAPYIPGWDCHGLPIELQVEKNMYNGTLKNNKNYMHFRENCRKYAYTQIKKQKKDFMRLGILGNWTYPYLTMDFITESKIIKTFGKIVNNGYIYKGEKPTHWCINCCSTLAESEVEYLNIDTKSIYVTFISSNIKKILKIFNVLTILQSISCIIWTTLPWTLLFNKAIAINPNYKYDLIDINGKGYIIASYLTKKFICKKKIKKWNILGNVNGSILKNIKFYHPFLNIKVPIILSKHINLEQGTGIVHISPSHGIEDYLIAKKYNIEIKNEINNNGYYITKNKNSFFYGLNINQINEKIFILLNNNYSLLFIENINHAYPHCWRHKTPIILRTTPQWFINMERNNLRKKTIHEISNVIWIPEFNKNRILNMASKSPDWCISRQRFWGVPIALFSHKKTNLLHKKTLDIINHISKLVEVHGVKIWWEIDSKYFIGNDDKYYNKIIDTLDVWFDSGTTHSTILPVRKELNTIQSDLYLEGEDQHRGWFLSSLITSVAINNIAPYKQVLTHGFVVDKYGKKMSKSLGNVINPQQIVNKFGADILRLWVASTNYTKEMTISDEVLKYTTDIYRRIRNTSRFLLSNLFDFNPQVNSILIRNMIFIDKWIIHKTSKIQNIIIKSYENYNFQKVVKYIKHFCSIELGSFYLDIIKDRQYTSPKNSFERRSCQTAMFHIIEALVRWISPIMSFTANEIWQFIPGKRNSYVFTEEWYNGLSELKINDIFDNNFWLTMQNIRNESNKYIEKARLNKIIKSSLDAHIKLYATTDIINQITKLENELCFLFQVSYIDIYHYKYLNIHNINIKNKSINKFYIVVSQAIGIKCKRCWHYVKNIYKNKMNLEICKRCFKNMFCIGQKRKFI